MVTVAIEIRRHLLLGRKAITNLDSILKSRDISLPTKVCLVKAMVFPVVMYGCESWTIKKAESRRIDAFEIWCCRRLLSVPWTARRCNQSILKEISPECSLEGLMLNLRLQFFGAQLSSQSSSHPYMTTGKTIALTRWAFVGKVMSLLFNMLSSLVITFQGVSIF